MLTEYKLEKNKTKFKSFLRNLPAFLCVKTVFYQFSYYIKE